MKLANTVLDCIFITVREPYTKLKAKMSPACNNIVGICSLCTGRSVSSVYFKYTTAIGFLYSKLSRVAYVVVIQAVSNSTGGKAITYVKTSSVNTSQPHSFLLRNTNT